MSDIPDSVTFTLKKPITHNDKTYSVLMFEEASAGDIAASETFAGEVTQTLAMHARMAIVPIDVIRKIKVSDLNKLNETVKPLMGEVEMGKPPGTTGQTS
jgi:hypothetical protein